MMVLALMQPHEKYSLRRELHLKLIDNLLRHQYKTLTLDSYTFYCIYFRHCSY